MASRAQLLGATFLTEAVNRLSVRGSFLLNRFGMQPGGPNRQTVRQREGAYPLIRNTREAGTLSAPDEPSTTVNPVRVGMVPYTLARLAEKKVFTYDELHGFMAPGGARITANTPVDEAGEQRVAEEQAHLTRRDVGFRLALLGGMLRGQVYVHQSGGVHYLSYTDTGAAFPINYQLPAANTGQLNMVDEDNVSIFGGNIIGASWATTTTDIPADVLQIRAGFERIGVSAGLMVMNSTTFSATLAVNDVIAEKAGANNQPYQLVPSPPLPDGTPAGFEVVIPGLPPNMRVVVSDETVKVGAPGSEAHQLVIPDNYVWIGPDPLSPQGRGVFTMAEFPEVAGRPGDMTARAMPYSYSVEHHDPARVDMFLLDNCLPLLKQPWAVAMPKVASF